MITTTFTGTPAECTEHMSRVYRSYHPAGYGTRIARTIEHDDGQITITITRAASCD